MKNKQRVVVIGNGMAGARFVEDLLDRGGGKQFEVVMFGDEPTGNYNRILLSSVLSGKHDAEDIFINPLAWYAAHGVALHSGVRVTHIDRVAKVVVGKNGVRVPYDKLVIATGSRAFLPAMAGLQDANGAFKSGVFAFRTLEDCSAIVAQAATAKRAVVIGGGLLGLEAARGLLARGLETHVVHLATHLMELQLDRQGGAILQTQLEAMGLHVHLEKKTTEIRGDQAVTGIGFADGGGLECDLVVISAGIRANTALAEQAGLRVDKGIVVGDDLAVVNDPNVFALGECAEHGGKMYGLVAPLWEQTQVLAERLSGKNPIATYGGSKVSTKLKVMGLDLVVMGERDGNGTLDEEIKYSEPTNGIYKKLIIRDGKLVGGVLLGDTTGATELLRLFARTLDVPSRRADLLFPSSGEATAPARLLELPDAAQICNCNGVSKGQIVNAIGAGCRSFKSLCDSTRAGTGCGSCKVQIQALLDEVAGDTKVEDPAIHYYVPGVPLPKPALVDEIKAQQLRSVSSVFAALSAGVEDAASKPGLASLLKTIWGKDYDDQRDARFINDRVHANIQKDGTYSVVPRIYGGVTSAAQLRRIADVADRHHVKMVKITGGQRIDLLGIPREELPEVWRELGMASGHAYTKSFRTCKTCVGSEFCRYGVGDSTGLGIAIEERFQGLESPAKMKLATAGCPRNCSEATTKDLGAVAVEGGKWELYIGGAAGSRVRKGDVLCVVDSQEAVLHQMGRFIQYYRENARYLERTYDFVERVGINRLRELLVNDTEGIGARLDAEIGAAVDAFVDPWKEANLPNHPSQFRSVMPGEPLSRVAS